MAVRNNCIESFIQINYIFFLNPLCHPGYIHIVGKYIIKRAVLNISLGFLFSALTAMNEKMCNIKGTFIRNKLHHVIWLNRWISMLQVAFHFIQYGNMNKILNVTLHRILYGPYLIIRYLRVVYCLHRPYLLALIMCFCVIVYSNALSTVQSIRLQAVACLISTDFKRTWNEETVACYGVISRYFPVKSV